MAEADDRWVMPAPSVVVGGGKVVVYPPGSQKKAQSEKSKPVEKPKDAPPQPGSRV